ncbi:snRNA-activating protein complex subunit 4 [Trichechus inunguis]
MPVEAGGAMDADAEREKIAQEIRELERILDPSSSGLGAELSESSLHSDSDADSLCSEDSDAPGPPISEEDRWGEASNEEEDPKDRNLPEDPETCLQLNMVYQEVVQEKITEVNLLLAQNREQQEEITWDLAGSKGPKMKGRKSLPPQMYIGHFMKPYFKDKVTGVGPPANEDMREKAAQGVKSFEELLVTKWKGWEKTLLRKSVVSDRLQRLLQPKLLKLEYLQQKQSRVSSETERQLLEKQLRDAEKEVEDIHQLPEEALLGTRLDSHDWEKIANVNFEGGRSAEEIRKFWQNCEHPSINKQEWSEDEVERLKAISARHGHLEWQKIAEELGTQRSAFQCLQKFQQHNKDLKRKEWTEEEDCMLTQLVQEMRVGSHIPYRRIVYYMEGRDSMQLIYRWTKSLDPSLRKGCWAPEEDAKLLQAVAKHGAQDWFKIREEVPGRSDAQCRDRYLRRLHFSLKKGRWSPREEEKLIELIEKHGAGHWAKIAAELPHRSGSQCLSKWKIMVGKKQSRRRRRRRPRRCVQWSSSSSSEDSGDSGDSGDSSSADSETELEDAAGAGGGGEASPSAPYVVPSVDLWVPARQGTTEPWKGGTWDWPARPPASPSTPKEAKATRGGSEEASVITSASRVDVSQAGDQELEGESGVHLQKVPLETVLQVLQANTAARDRELKEKLRQPPRPSPDPGPSSTLNGPSQEGSPPGPCGQRLWPSSALKGQRRQRQRRALQRRLLNRRLLMAVSPWVGDLVLPRTHGPPRPKAAQTRADGIWRQLQSTCLASTPVFTLLIQLFQIDADGCMEVIRERRTPPPTALHRLQAPLSAQHCPGTALHVSVLPSREAVTQSAGHKGSGGLGPLWPESAPPPVPSPAPSGPRPKPKTVSELLREKRLQEARARRTTLGARMLPVQLLVSSPGVPLPTLHPAPQGPPATGPTVCNLALAGLGAPTGASSGTAGSLQAAQTPVKEERPCALQTSALTPAGARSSALETSRSPALGPILSQQGGLGQSQTLSASRKQGRPELPPLLPAAPSPAQLPAFSLVPARVTASTTLPVTWVLTAPGLLPVSVPAMVGLPQPAGTPASGLSVTLLPSPAETPAGQCAQASPPGTPPALHSPAEVAGDSVSASGGPSSPGVAPGARETAAPLPPPKTSSQPLLLSGHPEKELPQPSHPPPHGCAGPVSSPVGTPGLPSGTGCPPALEKPPSPQLGPKKGTLDTSLLSPEGTADTHAWLRGQQGVYVPPLGSRLPYQPPTLCTLRTLSSLLLHKEALERKATALVPGGVAEGERGPPAGALQAALGMVHSRLRDSPAYLLLKARFLAAFSLPALLATLPPHGVPTTLSATAGLLPESEGEDLREPEPPDGEGLQARGSPFPLLVSQPSPGQASAPSCLDTPSDLRALRTRQGRKRRRLS